MTLTCNKRMAALVADGQAQGEPLYAQDPVAEALIAQPKFGLVSAPLAIG